MRTYVKPLFEFVVLAVEERFAGSQICTVGGTCPVTSALGCTFVHEGKTYEANLGG